MIKDVNNEFYALPVWAPDTPGFVSGSEDLYGFEYDLDKFMRERLEFDTVVDDEYLYKWQQWQEGEKDVTINVAYCDYPFLSEVELLRYNEYKELSFEFDYENIWGVKYHVKAIDVDMSVAWICQHDQYLRVVKVNSSCISVDDRFIAISFGEPGLVVFGDNDKLCSTMYMLDKSFVNHGACMYDSKYCNAQDLSIEPFIRFIIADT